MGSQGIIPPNPAGVEDPEDLLQGGVNELDADRLDVDVAFNNFTADTGPAEVDDPEQLGAILKGIDNALAAAANTVTKPVRNETGVTILKGRLVAVVGFSVAEDRVLVDLADKDTPALRPAVGVTTADFPNNTNANMLVSGPLVGVDTSAFALTDQLVLGNAGAFSRPPRDVGPTFTGEIQNVGSVARVDAVVGDIAMTVDGLENAKASEFFALQGTNGPPSDTNRYVTDSDLRLPTLDENDALQGTDGAPSAANRYVTTTDDRLDAFFASATGDTLGSLATDQIVSGMTIVVPATGVYVAEFSGSLDNDSNGAVVEMSIFKGPSGSTTIIPESERRYRRGSGLVSVAFHCMTTKVALNSGDVVEGRWRTSTGISTMHERVMRIRRVTT